MKARSLFLFHMEVESSGQELWFLHAIGDDNEEYDIQVQAWQLRKIGVDTEKMRILADTAEPL